MNKVFFVLLMLCCSSCATTYYVVRHAEKEAQGPNSTSDVALSAAGQERAEALKLSLQNKKIKHLFSTNTIRTTSTAKPLSDAIGVPFQLYTPADTNFVTRIKALGKGNVLIVGHSNTVDNLVNSFIKKTVLKDLADTEYNNLFIIKKKGKNFYFQKETYGK